MKKIYWALSGLFCMSLAHGAQIKDTVWAIDCNSAGSQANSVRSWITLGDVTASYYLTNELSASKVTAQRVSSNRYFFEYADLKISDEYVMTGNSIKVIKRTISGKETIANGVLLASNAQTTPLNLCSKNSAASKSLDLAIDKMVADYKAKNPAPQQKAAPSQASGLIDMKNIGSKMGSCHGITVNARSGQYSLTTAQIDSLGKYYSNAIRNLKWPESGDASMGYTEVGSKVRSASVAEVDQALNQCLAWAAGK